jgi:hypothetical protein
MCDTGSGCRGQAACDCVKECAARCGLSLTSERNENEQASGSGAFCQGHRSSLVGRWGEENGDGKGKAEK